jgi:ankyrin repeat protein
MRCYFLIVLPVALLLAGCGRDSPEAAKAKLNKLQVEQSPDILIAKTKDPKSENVAQLLVTAGVDPNARQPNGMTVLMSAVFNNQFDTAKALLEKGADVKLDAGGFNALSLAAEKGNLDMAKLLLAHGADPAQRPSGGQSALEKAQQWQNTAMVELLQSAKK